MAHLKKRVWKNSMLTTTTKIQVHQACVLRIHSTAAKHGSSTPANSADKVLFTCTTSEEFWVSHGKIMYQTKMSANSQASKACLCCSPNAPAWPPCMHGRWSYPQGLYQLVCMVAGHIPKDTLHGELAIGSGHIGRSVLCFKDVCKKDMRAYNISSAELEAAATNCSSWRTTVKAGIQRNEKREGRECRWQCQNLQSQCAEFTYSNCNRASQSRIRWYSHSRAANQQHTEPWHSILLSFETNDANCVNQAIHYCTKHLLLCMQVNKNI